jgi:hypothetical protein
MIDNTFIMAHCDADLEGEETISSDAGPYAFRGPESGVNAVLPGFRFAPSGLRSVM